MRLCGGGAGHRRVRGAAPGRRVFRPPQTLRLLRHPELRQLEHTAAADDRLSWKEFRSIGMRVRAMAEERHKAEAQRKGGSTSTTPTKPSAAKGGAKRAAPARRLSR